MGNGIKLVAFDLDGTLNRTDLFSVPAIRLVQQQLGFPISSYETIVSSYGTAYAEFMEILFPGGDAQTAKDYQRLIPAAEQQFLHLAKPYDGIPEMLDELHAKGYHTAVCSNSNLRYISTALKALHILEKIDTIQQLEHGMKDKGESLSHLIELLKPEKAVMVGDTLFDRDAAMVNHIPFIGCNYGFRPYEMAAVPNTVNAPSEIVPLVEQLIGSNK